MTIVEVFKTNVIAEEPAKELVSQLSFLFPKCRINFDLQDCDKILRVEGSHVEEAKIIEVVQSRGFLCNLLEG